MVALPLMESRKKPSNQFIRVIKMPRGTYADLNYGTTRVSLGRLDDLSPTTLLDQAVRVALGQIRVDDLEALKALQRANKSARWKDHQW